MNERIRKRIEFFKNNLDLFSNGEALYLNREDFDLLNELLSQRGFSVIDKKQDRYEKW